MSFPRHRIDLPRCAITTLHSAFVDYLIDAGDDVRREHLARAGGLDFRRWLLALMSGRYAVSVRDVDGTMLLGLTSTLSGDLDDELLFEIDAASAGVTEDWIVKAAVVDMDDELTELLGSGS